MSYLKVRFVMVNIVGIERDMYVQSSAGLVSDEKCAFFSPVYMIDLR